MTCNFTRSLSRRVCEDNCISYRRSQAIPRLRQRQITALGQAIQNRQAYGLVDFELTRRG